jgi:hypothetical protein
VKENLLEIGCYVELFCTLLISRAAPVQTLDGTDGTWLYCLLLARYHNPLLWGRRFILSFSFTKSFATFLCHLSLRFKIQGVASTWVSLVKNARPSQQLSYTFFIPFLLNRSFFSGLNINFFFSISPLSSQTSNCQEHRLAGVETAFLYIKKTVEVNLLSTTVKKQISFMNEVWV